MGSKERKMTDRETQPPESGSQQTVT